MSELIAEKLIDIESVQFSFNEHFTLTSGLKSPVYVDCRKIISFVKEREFIMDAAVNYIEKNKLELVVPRRAKLLFAISQLCPRLGDWVLRKKTNTKS